jgi:hypothetical protein
MRVGCKHGRFEISSAVYCGRVPAVAAFNKALPVAATTSLGPTVDAIVQRMQVDLGKKRKQLEISTGPMPLPESEPSSSNSSGPGSHRGGRGGRGSRAGGRGAIGAGQQQQPQYQEMSQQSIQDLVR